MYFASVCHSTDEFHTVDSNFEQYRVYRLWNYFITFRVSSRRREMYCGHARLCVCVCVCLSAAACLHYCTDPDVTWGSGRECPLVVHYWADLQSVHGLRCYGNITRTPNVSKYRFVLALCLVTGSIARSANLPIFSLLRGRF